MHETGWLKSLLLLLGTSDRREKLADLLLLL